MSALAIRPLTLLAAVLGAFTLAVMQPSSAHAGTYTVSSCRTPAGLEASTDAWKMTAYAPSIDHWGSTCPVGGLRLILDPGTVHPKDDVMKAVWTAPSDTFIVGYTYWRSVQVGAGSHYFFTQLERHDGIEEWVGPTCRGDYCRGIGTPTDPLAPANRWSRTPPQPVSAIGLYLSCGYYTADDPDCPASTPAMDVVLHRADITLSDDDAPSFLATPTGGLLATNQTLTGTQQVSFQAADKGGGIADFAIELDGKVVSHGVFGDRAGTCAPPYTVPVPCPLNASGTLAFDTSSVPDGDHRLRLLLRDAAGNVTPWGPITIRTYNTPPDTSCVPDPLVTGGSTLQLGAMPAPRHGRKAAKPIASRTVRYGSRIQVVGVLRNPGGSPIAAAPVCLVMRHDGDAGPYTPLARTTTGPDGSFTASVPNGPSREIVAIYRVGAGAVAGRAVIRVIPAVSVKLHRRVLHNGQVLVITGHLSGGPFPRRGVRLNMQAIRDGRWAGFGDAFRTTSRGTFRFRYRFTRTLGVQRYRLRIRAFTQAGYPYVAGHSRALTVRVIGQ